MAGNVKDLLRSLVGGIEGLVGAVVVGMDGATIEALKVDPNFSVEEISEEGAVASKVLDYMCQKLDGGPIDHIMLVAERYIVLLAMAGQDYYVGIVINPGKRRQGPAATPPLHAGNCLCPQRRRGLTIQDVGTLQR